MFEKWLKENDLSKVSFSDRLFPLASDRNFWGHITSADNIRVAEKYLGFQWPLMRATQFMEYHISGNRNAQEDPHFVRRNALLALFFGEVSEYKGRFLPDLCDGLFLICEETYWGLSAHSGPRRGSEMIPCATDPYIDLFAAQTAENIAMIYHVLYDEIKACCPQLPERIEYELERRIISPYLSREDFWWMGRTKKTVNNWNPWILSNLLAIFLTIPLPRSRFEVGLRKMMGEINVYYKTLPEDGGCDEGPNYWAHAGAKVFDFCNLLSVSTEGKINLFDDEKLKRIGLFMAAAYIGGQTFVNFADAEPQMRGNLDYALYAFGKAVKAPSLCQLAAALKRQRPASERFAVSSGAVHMRLYSLLYADEVEAQEEFVAEEATILPDLQTSYVRAGDWYCAAKGGHNDESHNHNDVGSFMVYHKNQPLLIDPGCGTYTKDTFSEKRYTLWTMQSGWHNLPVLNGCEQLNGKTYRADRFSLDCKTVCISFSGAYPPQAGVISAERRISVAEQGIRLEDRFLFRGMQNVVDEHFITLLPPQKNESGILLDGKYLIVTDLPCMVDTITFADDGKLVRSWGQDHVYRVKLSFACEKNATVNFEIRSTEV